MLFVSCYFIKRKTNMSYLFASTYILWFFLHFYILKPNLKSRMEKNSFILPIVCFPWPALFLFFWFALYNSISKEREGRKRFFLKIGAKKFSKEEQR